MQIPESLRNAVDNPEDVIGCVNEAMGVIMSADQPDKAALLFLPVLAAIGIGGIAPPGVVENISKKERVDQTDEMLRISVQEFLPELVAEIDGSDDACESMLYFSHITLSIACAQIDTIIDVGPGPFVERIMKEFARRAASN